MTTLLPPNATAQERALEAATARLGEVAVPVASVWNPAACPAALLPWLAWALSVDTWDAAWPESVKRQVIAASFAVHRVKGTVRALERALSALDLDAIDIREWPETGGDPYTFRLDVELSTRGVSADEEAGILAVVDAAKNARSHLDRLRVWLAGRGRAPVIGMAALAGEQITVFPHTVTELQAAAPAPVIAFTHYGVETTTLHPM